MTPSGPHVVQVSVLINSLSLSLSLSLALALSPSLSHTTVLTTGGQLAGSNRAGMEVKRSKAWYV